MKGIGAKSRERLAQVLRASEKTITPGDAATALSISASQSSKLLSFWARQGWLRRVRRGLYIPVPLDSLTEQVSPEDPWLLANRIFNPCYIGGWSAAEHWGLTEQIFSSVLLFTTKAVRRRDQDIAGTKFVIKSTQTDQFYGLKAVWRGKTKISVSDPSKTLVDALNDPEVLGGIRNVEDYFSNYLNSPDRNIGQILQYAALCNNASVFKRLGFFLERLAPSETTAIDTCVRSLPSGNSNLDPALSKDNLITRWKLWVPSSWTRGARDD